MKKQQGRGTRTNKQHGKSKQDSGKKNSKKEADKLVNDGVKLLEKIEDNKVDNVDIAYNSAESCFERALTICPDHADAIYNLATLTIERIDSEDNNGVVSNAIVMLKALIARDTSRRGETTGLSHRAIAAAQLRHYQTLLPPLRNIEIYDDLIADSQSHLLRAREILASHSSDLDTLIFEYCEHMHPLWLAYLERCKAEYDDYSPDKGIREMACSGQPPIAFIKAASLLRRITQTLQEALQTPQSNGIDMEVYMLWAEYLNDFVEGLVQGKVGRFAVMEAVDVQWMAREVYRIVEEYTQQCEMVCGTLMALYDSDEGADALVLAGDVAHNLVELHVAMRQMQMQNYVDHIPTECVNSLKYRQKGVDMSLSLPMLSALADEWVYMGKLLAQVSDDITLQNRLCGTLHSFIATCTHPNISHDGGSDGGGGGGGAGDVTVTAEEIELVLNEPMAVDWRSVQQEMYRTGKEIYKTALLSSEQSVCASIESAVLVSGNEDGGSEGNDTDLLAVTYYNTACVCWKLRDEEGCKFYLNKYIILERQKHVGDILGARNGEADNKLLDDILNDSDLEGIRECPWFLESF